MITLIWAMDRNQLIGNHGALPWSHISADMRWFRQQTEGKTVIMGRATFDSIGKPLPKRRNIVLSRQHTPLAGVILMHSIDAVLEMNQQQPNNEWMVIGGANLYAQMLEHANRLIYTKIDSVFEGDTWFPAFDNRQWQTTQKEHHPANETSPYALTFTCAIRNQ